jgi:hypothetical protein
MKFKFKFGDVCYYPKIDQLVLIVGPSAYYENIRKKLIFDKDRCLGMIDDKWLRIIYNSEVIKIGVL